MASERFTVRLDGEAAAWVEQMQAEHDRSRAWVIREAVNLARGEPSAFGGAEGTGAHRGSPHRDGAGGTADLRERVDELEQRVAMLEQGKIEEIRAETGVETADDTPTDSEAAHSGAVPVAGEDDPNPSPDASSGRGSADGGTRDLERWLDEGPPHEEHAKDAIRDLVTLLEEHGTMKTGDLKDELYERYGDHYGGKDSMWESIRRYLDEVPGVEKGGYGKYTTED